MSSFYSIESKLSGNVIDIVQASKAVGALLDAYPLKDKDDDNQLWEFVADPAKTGFYFIKSKLSGNCIDIQNNSSDSGAPLDVFPQQNPGRRNQLWAFNPDPAGSGFFFIRSMANGNVIDIEKASKAAGARLDAFPQKSGSGADNQLWKVKNGDFPGPVFTSLSWGAEGTGPAPNSKTVGSDGNQCAYQASLTIAQDGAFTFTGYYQNRGDVWWGTAPEQGFAISFVVFDTAGKAYAFTYLGAVPSAPQNGSLVKWNQTGKAAVIAENWFGIAAKNSGGTQWYNTYDESVWSVVGGWFSSLGQDIEIAAKDIYQAWENPQTSGDGGLDGGSDDDLSDQLRVKGVTLPALPKDAPTGAAATAHKATTPVAGQGVKAAATAG